MRAFQESIFENGIEKLSLHQLINVLHGFSLKMKHHTYNPLVMDFFSDIINQKLQKVIIEKMPRADPKIFVP